MSHELLNNNFFGYKEGGWHRLGQVSEEELPAMAVLRRFQPIQVTREPLYIHLPNGEEVEVPDQYVLLRHPVENDPELQNYESFGIVGPEYREVTHATAAQIWDEHVGARVETMGLLRGGRAMFVTTPLPTVGVRGEEVKMYLSYINWLEGGMASEACTTGTRMVCMNTVRMGLARATQRIRLVHDTTIVHRTATWLRGAYQRALAELPGMSDDMNALASFQLRPSVNSNALEQIKEILETAYPEPRKPNEDAPPDVMKGRWEKYQYYKDGIAARRQATVKLFSGQATGANSDAFKGTMWGLYQSVAQLEDRRRGGSDFQKAQSVMIGERGETIARTWDKAIEIISRN